MKYALLAAVASAALLSIGNADATVIAPITVTGTYTTSYQGTSGSGPTISDVLAGSFSEALSLNSALTTNFIDITPAAHCGCGYSQTANGIVTVTFTFTKPSGTTGTLTDTGLYTAFYGNPYSDSITWKSPDPIVVHFTDGAVLDVTLNNTSDWTLAPTVTFDLVADPSAVPEPMSIAILGAGLIGIGTIRRGRQHQV